MIKTLYIKNFALIDELEVSFEQGLNILTGQTGAGKSIILGALNMILGERADTEVIRQRTEKAVAEANIHIGENEAVQQILEKNEVELSSELILRREIRDSGSRAFINDSPTTIAVLKQVGNYLVDLHGQHDHQLLLKEENHRGVVDGFGAIKPSLESYRQRYHKMKSLKAELRNLKQREQELEEKLKLYRFQADELTEADLDSDEEEQLEAEMKLLDNAEALNQKAAAVVELGSEQEASIINSINAVKLYLEDMARIEPEFETYLEEITTARISIQEMVSFTERYRAGIEFNPQRLEQLRQRQNELNRLRNKYNRTVPELIEYLQDIQGELNLAENFDIEIEKLEEKIEEQADRLTRAVKTLHQKRVEVGKKLSASIVDELHNLAIKNAQFEVSVEWLQAEKGWIEIDGTPVECTEHGCDQIRLYISTNKGEAPKPLAKIASGGEISRVMLALKSTLAKQQSLPIMIFDEIDTGISGKVSEKVGKTMRRLSGVCQIIAITHQPQIASQAHKHYRVQKVEEDGRTVSQIVPLSEREHIREVAGLLSGEDITEAGLESARELVEKHTFQN